MSLHGSGPRTRADWADLVASLPKVTAVWADLDGMHRAPLPEAMPVGATHLWFWDHGRHGRVRIDGELWIAGILTSPERTVPDCCNAHHEDAIVVDRLTLTPWATQNGQVREKRVQQFRGDHAVLTGIAQLIPRRPTTGVFLAPVERA
jgi:hypothetical protein